MSGRAVRAAPALLLLILLVALSPSIAPTLASGGGGGSRRDPGTEVVRPGASPAIARPGSPSRPFGLLATGVVALVVAGWVVTLAAPDARTRSVVLDARAGARAPPAAI